MTRRPRIPARLSKALGWLAVIVLIGLWVWFWTGPEAAWEAALTQPADADAGP